MKRIRKIVAGIIVFTAMAVFSLWNAEQAKAFASVYTQIQGVSGSQASQQPFTLKLYDQPVTSQNIMTLRPILAYQTSDDTLHIFSSSYNMVYMSADIPAGTWYATLYTPYHLVNTKLIDTAKSNNMGMLLGGDAQDILKGSLTIDITDFSIFASAYEAQPGKNNWNPAADFNFDGYVNIADYSILISNYGKTSPRPQP